MSLPRTPGQSDRFTGPDRQSRREVRQTAPSKPDFRQNKSPSAVPVEKGRPDIKRTQYHKRQDRTNRFHSPREKTIRCLEKKLSDSMVF